MPVQGRSIVGRLLATSSITRQQRSHYYYYYYYYYCQQQRSSRLQALIAAPSTPAYTSSRCSICSYNHHHHHHHHHRYFSSSSSTSQKRGSSSSSSSSNSSTTTTSRDGWTLDDITGIISFNNIPKFQTIIGLEIHAQLDIPTKLFSSAALTTTTASLSHCPNDYKNMLLHPFDAAIPGYLPILSQNAIQKALIAATVLNCHVCAVSRFERKHYVYADLPFGYQITQQRWPLACNGHVTAIRRKGFDNSSKNKKKKMKNTNSGSDIDSDTVTCRINRIQLEQDTGKTTTTTTTTTTTVPKLDQQSQQQAIVELSRIDFNRAGCALLEIVLEPNIRTLHDATCIVETIRSLLKHTQVCGGHMEYGQLRVDLNINIEEIIMMNKNKDDNKDGDDGNNDDSTRNKKLQRQRQRRRRSPRVEVKNLNSIRQVQQAAEYEVLRQAQEWQDHYYDNYDDTTDIDNDSKTTTTTSRPWLEETRTWNASTKQTILIRYKDQEHDYRFLPEPDLPPLVLYPSPTPTKNNDNNNNSDHYDDNNYLFPSKTDMYEYIKKEMPELPEQAVQRLVTQYGLSNYQAQVITSDPPAIAFFDQAYTFAMETLRQQQQNDDSSNNNDNDDTTRHGKSASVTAIASMVANYLCNDLFGLLKDHHHQNQNHLDGNESFNDSATGGGGDYHYAASIQDSPVTAEQLGEVVALVLNGTISKTMAKNLLVILYKNVEDNGVSKKSMSLLSVAEVAAKHGFRLVSDPVQLRELVENVLNKNVEAHDLERYFTMDQKVQTKLFKFFTGQCMTSSQGNAEPEALREALEQVLLQMQQERRNQKRDD